MKFNENQLYDLFLKETNTGRLQKIIAKYEIFKNIMDVPGDICEFGVFKGSGIFTWVKLMRIFKPNNDFNVVGFDFFEKKDYPKFKFKLDKKVQSFHTKGAISKKELIKKCKGLGFQNLKLYAGDVKKTSRKYANEHFGSRIALLYLDVDNYEGTLEILKNLYHKMAKGGVVVFDEYAFKGHGESEAVDEFFKEKKIKLKSFSWANSPTAYTIVE